MDEKDDYIGNGLIEGNRGAIAYFEKRVELMLRDGRKPEDLHRFLKVWWPSYTKGRHKRFNAANGQAARRQRTGQLQDLHQTPCAPSTHLSEE